MLACFKGLTEMVIELLMVGGLDVNLTALMWAYSEGHTDTAMTLLRDQRVNRHLKSEHAYNALGWARTNSLEVVVTRFKALDRGDERMPLVKVHHRYLHGDVGAEGAQTEAPHPPGRRSRKHSWTRTLCTTSRVSLHHRPLRGEATLIKTCCKGAPDLSIHTIHTIWFDHPLSPIITLYHLGTIYTRR